MAKHMHYERFIEAPELAQVCLNCTCVHCDGICDTYREAYRAFIGDEPLLKPTKREKIQYQYQKTYKHGGETHTLKEWAKITGQPYMRLYMRMWKYGMTFDEAIVV